MRGLLIKEWYARRLGLLAAAALGVFIYFRIPDLFFMLMLTLPPVLSMVPVSALQTDAVSHFDRWYPVLPVKRRTYADLFFLEALLLTALYFAVYLGTYRIFLHDILYAGDIAVLTMQCLLTPAVCLPLTFRFGITAGRVAAIAMILPEILLLLAAWGLDDVFGRFGDTVYELLFGNLQGITVTACAAVVLLFILAWAYSAAVLERREY